MACSVSCTLNHISITMSISLIGVQAEAVWSQDRLVPDWLVPGQLVRRRRQTHQLHVGATEGSAAVPPHHRGHDA